MSKLRVLILADARSFHTQRFVTAMQEQGIDIDLASCECEGTSALPIGKSFTNHSWRYHFGVSDLKSIHRAKKYDLVNAHFVSGYGFLASRAVPNATPVVLHAWGSDILIVPRKSILHRWKTMRAIRRAKIVVADSDFLATETQKLVPTTSTKVIPWGIESRYFQPITPKQFKMPLRLVSPRRLEPVYGIKELIEDLREELKLGQVTLTIPGFGSQRTEIESMIDAQQIPGITFYEMMDRDTLMQTLREHDCYCSNSSSDSSPVSLLEAQAVGLFPIVKSHPGVLPWMRKGAGLLIGRDCQTFKEAIHAVTSGQIDFHTSREENQKRVRMHASWEENIAETIRLFERVVAAS